MIPGSWCYIHNCCIIDKVNTLSMKIIQFVLHLFKYNNLLIYYESINLYKNYKLIINFTISYLDI